MEKTQKCGGRKEGKWLFVIVLIIISSCNNNQNTLKTHLRFIKELNPSIPIDGWTVHNYEFWSNIINYDLIKETADTTYFLGFKKIKHDSIFNPGEDIYVILHFTREFKDKQFQYILDMQKDTNYFYKTPQSNPDSMIFIVGKYCFLFNHGNLTNEQKSYYFHNRDSLRKIRGNYLPELPN